MKTRRGLIIALLFIAAATATGAQEADTPLFLQNMFEQMLQYGWTGSQVDEMEEECGEYQWEHFDQVDPQMIMRALRYSFEYGEQNVVESTATQAAWAHALASQAQEMLRQGMEPRDIAVVAASATRESLETMARNELANPDVGDMLRTRLHDATQDHLAIYDRDRIRDGSQSGPGYRHNEDGDPGVPPGAPVDPPGPGPQGPKNQGD